MVIVVNGGGGSEERSVSGGGEPPLLLVDIFSLSFPRGDTGDLRGATILIPDVVVVDGGVIGAVGNEGGPLLLGDPDDVGTGPGRGGDVSPGNPAPLSDLLH